MTTYHPGPKQALFLWRMISAETEEGRSPLKSKAKPELTVQERKPLLDHRFIAFEKHGRAERVVLTDRAWAWAAEALDVEIMKSRSPVGAEALQGLLRRLLPFLQEREIPLAALFSDTPSHALEQPGSNITSRVLSKRIEEACLSLGGGTRQTRVRLFELRKQLSTVARRVLDDALLKLQDEGRLVLYRDDNTAALTEDDHRAALSVGGAPRHLVYLEA